MVIYGQQRNHMLQDLTGLEIQTYMKASETENRFEASFQQPKSSLPKNGINIPSCYTLVSLHSAKWKFLSIFDHAGV